VGEGGGGTHRRHLCKAVGSQQAVWASCHGLDLLPTDSASRRGGHNQQPGRLLLQLSAYPWIGSAPPVCQTSPAFHTDDVAAAVSLLPNVLLLLSSYQHLISMLGAEAKTTPLLAGGEVDAWLAGIHLAKYGYGEALKQEGYDQLAFLQSMDDAEATRLAKDVAHMKVPHQRAFLAAVKAMKAPPPPHNQRPPNGTAQRGQTKPFQLMRERWQNPGQWAFFCSGDFSERLMVKPFPEFNPDDWAGRLNAQQYAEIEASLRTNFPAAQGTSACQRCCISNTTWLLCMPTLFGLLFADPCVFKLVHTGVSAR
jgi:hypothetical protein